MRIEVELSATHQPDQRCELCRSRLKKRTRPYERQIGSLVYSTTLPVHYCTNCDLETGDLPATIEFLRYCISSEGLGPEDPMHQELGLLEASLQKQSTE